MSAVNNVLRGDVPSVIKQKTLVSHLFGVIVPVAQTKNRRQKEKESDRFISKYL